MTKKRLQKIVALFMVVAMILNLTPTSTYATASGWNSKNTSINKGTADHIDIGVNTTATMVIDGVTYTASITLTKNDILNNVTVEAWWNGETFDDFSYDASSATSSSGSSSVSQWRIGTSYPVGTKDNPVYYQVTLKKTVTFTSADNTSTFDVNMDFVSDKFNYWDTDNDCPPLWNGNTANTSWTNGGFVSGSGLDFTLAASSEQQTILVNKYIVDENGNALVVDSAVTYDFDVYQDLDENLTIDTTKGDGVVNSDTFTVAANSSSSNYTTLVDVGYYCILEDTDSLAGTTITSGGQTYTYSTTYTSSSGVLESTGTTGTRETDTGMTGILKTDASTTPVFNIYNVYVSSTTSVDVTKVWDDDSDAWGIQPAEVEVTLYADGYTTGQTLTLDSSNNWTGTFKDLDRFDNSGEEIQYTVVETAVNGYSSEISGTAAAGYTITNTVDTGSLTLAKTVNADSSVDTSSMTFTFVVSGFDADATATVTADIIYSDGTTGSTTYTVSGGSLTVTVPADGLVTLSGIPAGTYTVTESGESGGTATANGHTWTVTDSGATVTVVADKTAEATISNTIADEETIVVTKYWVDSSNANSLRPDSTDFTVTLTAEGLDAKGNSKTYTYTITGSQWSGSSTSSYWNSTVTVAAYDELGNKLVYSVTESSVNESGATVSGVTGYTLDYIRVGSSATDYTEYSGTTGSTALSEATLTPAKGENYATLSNGLDTADIKVTKTVLSSNGTTATNNEDNFRFLLYDSNKTLVGTYTLTMSSSGTLTHTFEDLPLGTYYLKEELVSGNAHGYTVTVQAGTETVTADSDGYYEITLDTDDAEVAVAVTNTETPLTYDITTSLSGTKTLTNGDDLAAGASLTFYYYVTDASTDETITYGTATVTNSAYKGVAIDFTPATITYDHAGTYSYIIRESSLSEGGVVYDSARYDLTVVVAVGTDGKLYIASTSMTKTTTDASSGTTSTESASSADFTNTYNVDETSLTLRARKSFAGTLRENQFTLVIQGYTDDTFTTKNSYYVESKNGSAGYFGDTITYDDNGTYYYTVSEKTGTESGVSYDDTVYYITVTVETDASTNARKVTSVTYHTNKDATETSLLVDNNGVTTLQDLTFTNGYTASGSADLSVIKVIQGRDFVAGETFTFLVTPEDDSSPVLTAADGNDNVSVTANSDGTYTVVVTVPSGLTDTQAEDKSSVYSTRWLLGNLVLNESHIGGSYTYRISELEASNDNGMTLDTAAYGHLVTVTVSDSGNGVVTAEVTSTNDTDWNKDGTTVDTMAVVVNDFSQGEVSVAGTKTWVDGGLPHTNSSEVQLMLYRTTDKATEIDEDTVWELVTTDMNGDSIVDSNDYITTVVWTTSTNWTILNLYKYDTSGNEYTYKVVEKTIDGYTTTYGTYGSVSTNYNTAIKNTITQGYVNLTGTKTWVDGNLAHTDSDITLIVAQDGTELIEGKDYTVTWTKDTSAGTANGEVWTYTIVGTDDGLPMYDETTGAAYTYTVTEQATNGEITVTIGTATYTYTAGDPESDGSDEEKINGVTYVTYSINFTNTREEEDSTTDKTESGTSVTEGTTSEGTEYILYEDVSVDGEITYTIRYYNGSSEEATVTITDVLDNGVTFVSATNPDSWTGTDVSYSISGQLSGTDSNGNTYSYGGTVTWEFPVAAFEKGFVTLTVAVNENAKVSGDGLSADWADTATVDNQATVTIGGNDLTTNIVTNPLTEDDPKDPEKSIIYVGEPIYDTNGDVSGYETQTDTDGYGNIIVSEGDRVIYRTTVYNNTNTTQSYLIVDTLDEGVEVAAISMGGTYTDVEITVDGVTIPANSVYWQISVFPFSTGTAVLYLNVTEAARDDEQTYYAVDPETGEEYDFTYTDVASIANQASVYVGGATTAIYTNVDENPLDPDKDVYGSTTGTSIDGQMVSIGDTLTYDIDWMNTATEDNQAVEATITIKDTIPTGTTYVAESATSKAPDGETSYTVDLKLYASDGTTVLEDTEADAEDVAIIKWTITADALAYGSVSFQVEVAESAVDNTDNAITNDANVEVAANNYEYSYTTNTTTNYVPGKDVYDAEQYEEAAADDNVDAISIDGDLVGLDDVLLYTIDWQNTESTDAVITITDDIPNGTDYVCGSATSAANVSGQSSFSVTLYDLEGNELKDTEENAGNVATIVWTFTAEAGISGTVTFEVEVTEGAFELNSIDNTATVAIGNNKYTTNTVTNTVPTKTADVLTSDSDVLVEGDVVEYTIDFVNTAEPSFDLNNPTKVIVTDTLTKGISYNDNAAITLNGTVYTGATLVVDEDSEGRQVLTWTFEELPVGVEVVITFTITVGSDAPSHITNQAAVDGHKTNIVISPVPSDDEKNVLDEDNQIVDGENVSVGDTLTYEISWTNMVKDEYGNDTYVYADEVTIVDTLPDGIKVDASTISHQGVYAETTDAQTGKVTRTITWTFSNLDTSDIVRGTVWFEATVTGEETVMENTAVIITDNEYEVSVTVYMPQKDVTDANDTSGISIDGETVKVGDELSYEITVINTAMDGSDPVDADVTVVDYIPDGTVFVPGTADSTLTADGLTTAGTATVRYFDANDSEITTVTADNAADVEYIEWTFTDMPANATGTVSFNVTVTEAALSNAGYAVTNDATLIIYENEYTTNTVINKVTEKDVSYADDADQTSVDGELIGVGSELEYAVYWVNTATDEEGSAAATITITDDIPDGTEYAGSVSAYLEDGTDITASVEITLYTLNETTGDYEVTDGTDTTLVDRIVWVIDADADAAGTVTFTVTVTEDAVTNESNEISNTAGVVILLDNVAVVTYDTNTTTNYVPEKDVYDAEQYADAMTSTEDEVEPESIDGEGVEIGDELTYEITFLNTAKDENGDYVAAETITVTDIIPTGTTYVAGSAAYADVAKDVTIQFYADTARTLLLAETDVDNETTYYDVTTGDVLTEAPEDFAETVKAIAWVFTEVEAEAEVTVSFNVIVTAEAADNDNNAVENYATVKIQVNDDDPGVDVTTNTVTNYVPEDPEKIELTITAEDETTEDAVAVPTDEDGNITYQSVSVGDTILYEIDYYNHYATEATVVITDTLEAGLTYVEGSASGVEKSVATADDKIVYEVTEEDGIVTITWTITVEAFETGSVTFEATVNDTAKLLGENETQATVENDATVEVGEVTRTTNLVINPLEDDDPDDPTKTVSANSPSGHDADAEIVYDETDDTDAGTLTGDTVGVGSMIEYVISYYNNHSATATVTITDVLDEGVNFLSASGTTTVPDDTSVEAIGYDYVTYSYSEADHTVTWTIYNATAFAYGEVILVVQVNENAKTVEAGETTAAVENEASVQIGTDNAVDTNIVVNPIDPEDPGDPEKIVAADSAAGVNGAAVAVDDEITYQITYYNHTNTAADITITDVLDPGVEFVSATVADGISYNVTTATDGTVTVTWTITDVTAYTGGYVELVVKVTEDALSVVSGETVATVENQATVTVGDVSNDTNIVINQMEDDDPVTPTKTITTEGVAAGDEVAVGDELTYTITYYNHTNEVTTVVITDKLDDGVDYVSSTEGGVYDSTTHTVTWTLTVDPFTSGSVTVTVEVNSSAVTQVSNTASVKIGNEDVKNTNTVENPLEEEVVVVTEPVPTTSDTEAVVPYTIMMLMAFVAIVALLKGRRREEQA